MPKRKRGEKDGSESDDVLEVCPPKISRTALESLTTRLDGRVNNPTWLELLRQQESQTTISTVIASTEPTPAAPPAAHRQDEPLTPIDQTVLTFLRGLTANLSREWFQAHKSQYDIAHKKFLLFARSFLQIMNRVDSDIIVMQPPAGIVSRIYRDLRFSKDQTPYRTEMSVFTTKRVVGKKTEMPGYYLCVKGDGTSFFGGGAWQPPSSHASRIRNYIQEHAVQLRQILANTGFVESFGKLSGSELVTAPRGIPKTHPDLDLLKKTDWIATRKITDAELLAPDFFDQMESWARALRPLIEFLWLALA
eukprot:TRINITY_DN7397_c0_g1_i1.p1 TRINITY_DN7397_c0_g1~~TRINITY_DN7397_c0_g1_i1.p1  ORF type:complete len:307 (+),score=49.38 TRINITY_DN7397_c0_g1_i1:32-952(+)